MKQKGTVIQTEGHMALVAVPRASACGDNCTACAGGCQAQGHQARVKNAAGARPGDVVLLAASDAAVLRAALLLYGLPLVLFFMGLGLGYTVFPHTPAAVATGLLTLAVSFCIIKLLDKKIAPRTEITEILMTDTEKRSI